MKKDTDITPLLPELEAATSSKASYLAWRSRWRNSYREVSLTIRSAKLALANCYRAHDYACAKNNLRVLFRNQQTARVLLRCYTEAKRLVRERLRAAGLNAPDPKVRPAPAPRPRHIWTPEERETFKALDHEAQQGVLARFKSARRYQEQQQSAA